MERSFKSALLYQLLLPFLMTTIEETIKTDIRWINIWTYKYCRIMM